MKKLSQKTDQLVTSCIVIICAIYFLLLLSKSLYADLLHIINRQKVNADFEVIDRDSTMIVLKYEDLYFDLGHQRDTIFNLDKEIIDRLEEKCKIPIEYSQIYRALIVNYSDVNVGILVIHLFIWTLLVLLFIERIRIIYMIIMPSKLRNLGP